MKFPDPTDVKTLLTLTKSKFDELKEEFTNSLAEKYDKSGGIISGAATFSDDVIFEKRGSVYRGLTYLGTNITGGVANDNNDFWRSQGNGVSFFNQTGMITNQPTQYGFVFNHVQGDIVYQEWQSLSNGAKYRRGVGSDSYDISTVNWTRFIDTAQNGQVSTSMLANASVTSDKLGEAVKTSITNGENSGTFADGSSALKTAIGTTNFTVNDAQLKRRGKLAGVYMSLSPKNTIASGTELFAIPSGFRPLVPTVLGNYATPSPTVGFRIKSSNGGVVLFGGSIASGSTYLVCGTWLIG